MTNKYAFVGDNLIKQEKPGTNLFFAAVMLQTGTYKRAKLVDAFN